MSFWKKIYISCLAILVGLANLSPLVLSLRQLRDDVLVRANWPSSASPATGSKPHESRFDLYYGKLKITSSAGQWESPDGWIVQQAAWSDLNHDKQPEVTLLVRRPFKPWPVDEVLPFGGRINRHQDAEGMSSHIIMICWKGDHWGELWAGSALARPVRSFAIVDMDGDAGQELVVREGDYQDVDPSIASTLAVWQWNGFGFDLISRVDQSSRQIIGVRSRQNTGLILLQ